MKRIFDALLTQVSVVKGDYEVVVIDDGSTDGSGIVANAYAKQNSIIRVISQHNQGLSCARNRGVEEALGDYVWFVDADDCISREAVSSICRVMNTKPDIIAIYAKNTGEDNIRNRIPSSLSSGKAILLNDKWEQCGVFWVIKKTFLCEKRLSFFPGIYHEDAEFTPRLLYFAQSVVVVPKVLYYVFLEPNSITTVPIPKRAYDCLVVANHLIKFIRENNEHNSSVGKVFYNQAALMINNGFSIIILNSLEEQRNFNIAVHENKNNLEALCKSNVWKYKLEGLIFSIFPFCYVQSYKFLKILS